MECNHDPEKIATAVYKIVTAVYKIVTAVHKIVTAVYKIVTAVYKIVTAVHKKWVSGTGMKPVTWQTLVDVLRDIELNSLVDEIGTALK